MLWCGKQRRSLKMGNRSLNTTITDAGNGTQPLFMVTIQYTSHDPEGKGKVGEGRGAVICTGVRANLVFP